MDSGNEPAYPTETDGHKFEGLTKRELFAMAAMQGLCACDASPNYDKGPHNVPTDVRAALTALEATQEQQALRRDAELCGWDEEHDGDTWATGCGHVFQFIDGTPSDNRFVYCCYCGRKIEETRCKARGGEG